MHILIRTRWHEVWFHNYRVILQGRASLVDWNKWKTLSNYNNMQSLHFFFTWLRLQLLIWLFWCNSFLSSVDYLRLQSPKEKPIQVKAKTEIDSHIIFRSRKFSALNCLKNFTKKWHRSWRSGWTALYLYAVRYALSSPMLPCSSCQ